VWVRGRSIASAEKFCFENVSVHNKLEICAPHDVPGSVDVVILLTTSREVIYNHAAMPGLLIIGVGAFKPEMAEIGATTLAGSIIYVDDLKGARVEAGDLLQAAVDWTTVKQLADALRQKPSLSQPVVFKTVGTAAWDLAAGKLAVATL